MGNGLSQGPKTEVCNSGMHTLQLYSVCFRDTRTLVSTERSDHYRMNLNFGAVISIDLSPAGNVLATGSGDWQARICTSFHQPCDLFVLALMPLLCCLSGSYQAN